LFFLAIAAQWQWSTHGSIAGVSPQLLLVLTAATATSGSPLLAMALGFFWGLFLDVWSAHMVGANALLLTLLAYAVSSVKRKLDLSGILAQCCLVAGVTVFYFTSYGVLGAIFMRRFFWSGWTLFLTIPIYNAFVAAVVYIFGSKFFEELDS
jgi:rod shape-determining protein MreD